MLSSHKEIIFLNFRNNKATNEQLLLHVFSTKGKLIDLSHTYITTKNGSRTIQLQKLLSLSHENNKVILFYVIN